MKVVWYVGLVGAVALILNGVLTIFDHPLPQPLHSVVRYGGLALMLLGFGLSLLRKR